jgi:hypothetical protein
VAARKKHPQAKAARTVPPRTPSDRSDAVREAYRRIRKPMPPPDQVIPDKRRQQAEREAEREMHEDTP